MRLMAFSVTSVGGYMVGNSPLIRRLSPREPAAVDFHRDRSPSRGATRGVFGFPRLVTQEIKCSILFPTPETNCPRYAQVCHGNMLRSMRLLVPSFGVVMTTTDSQVSVKAPGSVRAC